jgi:hypothetical protein
MKKTILFALVLLSVLSAEAQKEPGTVTVYPRVGINMSKLNKDIVYIGDGEWSSYSAKAKYKFGFTAGAEVQYQFSTFCAVSGGLLYSLQGSKMSDTHTESATNYENFTGWRQNLHYLNMPILGIVYMGYSGVSIKAGVQFGYLLAARSKNSYESGTIVSGRHVPNEGEPYDCSTNDLFIFKRYDVSIPLGIAYEKDCFAVDLRYDIGLAHIYKYLDDKICNRSIVLTIGYGFDI